MPHFRCQSQPSTVLRKWASRDGLPHPAKSLLLRRRLYVYLLFEHQDVSACNSVYVHFLLEPILVGTQATPKIGINGIPFLINRPAAMCAAVHVPSLHTSQSRLLKVYPDNLMSVV